MISVWVAFEGFFCTAHSINLFEVLISRFCFFCMFTYLAQFSVLLFLFPTIMPQKWRRLQSMPILFKFADTFAPELAAVSFLFTAQPTVFSIWSPITGLFCSLCFFFHYFCPTYLYQCLWFCWESFFDVFVS